MTAVMLARRTGTVLVDGHRRLVRKGRTTAHADHSIVDRYPHLWEPLSVDYATSDEPEQVDVTPPGKSPGSETTPAAAAKPPTPSQVRRWAADNDIDVPARGKPPAAVYEQYARAHGG